MWSSSKLQRLKIDSWVLLTLKIIVEIEVMFFDGVFLGLLCWLGIVNIEKVVCLTARVSAYLV